MHNLLSLRTSNKLLATKKIHAVVFPEFVHTDRDSTKMNNLCSDDLLLAVQKSRKNVSVLLCEQCSSDFVVVLKKLGTEH